MKKYILIMMFFSFSYAASSAAVEDINNELHFVGANECLSCHKDGKRQYKNNWHSHVLSKQRGKANHNYCENCHGPGEKHLNVAGEIDYQGDMYISGFSSKEPSEVRNSACLMCHERDQNMHWHVSSHNAADVACADCHQFHQTKRVEAVACANCHRRQRAKLQRSRHMPLREGLMGCSDCHNPHGGQDNAQLVHATTNETCYRCHAEKRGPLIWEHPPVRENCGNCHDPHGSNHGKLLKRPAPFLCQSCHSDNFHPSTLYDGNALGRNGSRPARQLAGKACLNCHSMIHGSNHPSGARFQR